MNIEQEQNLFHPNSLPGRLANFVLLRSRLEPSGDSIRGLNEMSDALQTSGGVILDLHIGRRHPAKIPQMMDLGISLSQAINQLPVKHVLLAAAGDFYYHPLNSWIREYPPDGDQLLHIYDVYSKRRDSMSNSRSSKYLSPEEMEEKNKVFHSKAREAIKAPNYIVALNPFAGINPVGVGSVPRRVSELLSQGPPVLLSATWLSPRGYVTGFSGNIEYFKSEETSKEITEKLHISFGRIYQRIR